MNPAIRHSYEAQPPMRAKAAANLTVAQMTACRCGKARRNIIHRLGGRCSMCFRYFRHYELDSSRRCDECRP